jgi:predicted Zn finger-like uncharacterized protein
MSITVNCPHCQQRSIVAEQHNGRTVKCPSCGQSFQVAFPIPDDEHSVVPPTDSETLPRGSSHKVPSNSEARQRLLGPAIGLMVTGGLTTLMGLMFLPALLFPGLMGEQVPIDPAELAFSLLFMLLSLTLGIVTLHGSIKMIQLRSHPLSMAAAVAAMVPCYCCLLGLPMGIWALVVLNDKEVKQAFK